MSLRKTRPVTDPYETWLDPRTGWTWKVLKFYKSRENTLADEYGRVFCEVDGFEKELGDVYYSEITKNATLLSSNYGE
jgi:hypothetical protein